MQDIIRLWNGKRYSEALKSISVLSDTGVGCSIQDISVRGTKALLSAVISKIENGTNAGFQQARQELENLFQDLTMDASIAAKSAEPLALKGVTHLAILGRIMYNGLLCYIHETKCLEQAINFGIRCLLRMKLACDNFWLHHNISSSCSSSSRSNVEAVLHFAPLTTKTALNTVRDIMSCCDNLPLSCQKIILNALNLLIAVWILSDKDDQNLVRIGVKRKASDSITPISTTTTSSSLSSSYSDVLTMLHTHCVMTKLLPTSDVSLYLRSVHMLLSMESSSNCVTTYAGSGMVIVDEDDIVWGRKMQRVLDLLVNVVVPAVSSKHDSLTARKLSLHDTLSIPQQPQSPFYPLIYIKALILAGNTEWANSLQLLHLCIKEQAYQPANALAMVGTIIAMIGDSFRALDSWTQCLVLDPTNVVALTNTATLYTSMRRTASAITTLERLVSVLRDATLTSTATTNTTTATANNNDGSSKSSGNGYLLKQSKATFQMSWTLVQYSSETSGMTSSGVDRRESSNGNANCASSDDSSNYVSSICVGMSVISLSSTLERLSCLYAETGEWLRVVDVLEEYMEVGKDDGARRLLKQNDPAPLPVYHRYVYALLASCGTDGHTTDGMTDTEWYLGEAMRVCDFVLKQPCYSSDTKCQLYKADTLMALERYEEALATLNSLLVQLETSPGSSVIGNVTSCSGHSGDNEDGGKRRVRKKPRLVVGHESTPIPVPIDAVSMMSKHVDSAVRLTALNNKALILVCLDDLTAAIEVMQEIVTELTDTRVDAVSKTSTSISTSTSMSNGSICKGDIMMANFVLLLLRRRHDNSMLLTASTWLRYRGFRLDAPLSYYNELMQGFERQKMQIGQKVDNTATSSDKELYELCFFLDIFLAKKWSDKMKDDAFKREVSEISKYAHLIDAGM